MAGRKVAVNWEYWRQKYVSGDDAVTLDFLSKLPNAPVLGSLKNRASKEEWSEQRKQFRYQTMTKVTESAVSQEAVVQTQKLIDSAEIITQHMQLSRAMKSIVARRLKDFDPIELAPKDLVAWVNAATAIDRTAMGLATEKVEVDLKIDFSKLSDEQLERLAAGEDLKKVGV